MTSPADSLFGRGGAPSSRTKTVVLVVAFIIALTTIGPLGIGMGGSGLVSIALMLGGWWLLYQRRPLPPPLPVGLSGPVAYPAFGGWQATQQATVSPVSPGVPRERRPYRTLRPVHPAAGSLRTGPVAAGRHRSVEACRDVGNLGGHRRRPNPRRGIPSASRRSPGTCPNHGPRSPRRSRTGHGRGSPRPSSASRSSRQPRPAVRRHSVWTGSHRDGSERSRWR